jgi:hypothetical protein
MAHTPASYHAPALHYRAKGICSCKQATNGSGSPYIHPLVILSCPIRASLTRSVERSQSHCTGPRPDRGYEAIKIELRNRLCLKDFLTFYRVICSFIYHIINI